MVQFQAALRVASIVVASLGGAITSPTAHAQACQPAWQPMFGGLGDIDWDVHALSVFDDGSGARLYAGGAFANAGGLAAKRVAQWDGHAWAPLGLGTDGIVFALAVFDDGGGAALYAGGEFVTAGGVLANGIARWDGASWSALATGVNGAPGVVHSLAVFDDGGGAALYVGGTFATAGGVAANGIAKWDGTNWSALAGGVSGAISDVRALAVFDDGGGNALYASGEFTSAGGVPANGIAKWDGVNWSALAGGVSGAAGKVYALTIYDDGGGPTFVAGGQFTSAGGVAAESIARWDGSSWSPFGSGITGTLPYLEIDALATFDDGSGAGPALYAGGYFDTAGGTTAYFIAKWNGTNWSALGNPVKGVVKAFATFDDGSGSGPELFIGGLFGEAGPVEAVRIAKCNGTSCSPIGAGVNEHVHGFTVFDEGSGPVLFVGGDFNTVNGKPISGIARWDGASFSPLGSAFGTHIVDDTQVFDEGHGSGPALFVGGYFTVAGGVPANYIARWNGTSWSPLGNGVSNEVRALTVFADKNGPALYAGGNFLVAGTVSAARIAKWNGTSWSALGLGVGYGAVIALEVFDDGSGGGPSLYVGGSFGTVGPSVVAPGIAQWNGTKWSPLRNGMNGAVNALAVYDDGTGGGPALYAGGAFTTADGLAANRVAKWNGLVWSAVGSGTNGVVMALTVYDDGTGGGPALFAGGSFTTAGGLPANRLAKWDGANWTPLGSGTNNDVYGMGVFDDGSGDGAALYVGGLFTSAFDTGDAYIAKWTCPSPCGSIVKYGNSCAGSGGYKPSLSLSGCATSGGSVTFRIDDARGGNPAFLFVGSNPAATPVGGGCFLNVTPLLAQLGPMPLFGVGSGQGFIEITTTLPANLPNATASVTAACVDPGAPLGFTLTNGVRLTITN